MISSAKLADHIRPGFLVSLTTLALLVTAPPLFAEGDAAQEGQNFLVEFEDEKLSVKGESIPVKDLLMKIQETTGIVVKYIADPTGTVTLDENQQSVEQVIAKISDNHMIIHDNTDGTKTIRELFFISGATQVARAEVTSEFLPTGEPAPLVAAAGTSSGAVNDDEATDEKL